LEFRKSLGLKYEFEKVQGFILKIAGALVKRINNLEGVQSSRYKMGAEIRFYSEPGTGLKFLKRKGGSLARVWDFPGFFELFFEEKAVDSVHRLWTNTGTRSTMDQGPGACGTGHWAHRSSALRRCGSSALSGGGREGDGDVAMSGEPSPDMGRRRDGDGSFEHADVWCTIDTYHGSWP
jgi:hypothetical protein